jgi:N2-citryl-N6-acetyl-N6-hydroxylysine synthase
MIKCSLNVRITNAVRTLFHFEALRSRNIDYFKRSAMGQTFLQQYPYFHLLSEWAHMALKDLDGKIMDASLLLLRENPFVDKSAIMLATLCEEKARQNYTHLTHLIDTIARREAKTIEETAIAWFVRFLNVYLEPLLIAASHCGFLISAHQQNTLLALEDGWPVAAYIRDGQGTAFVLQKKDVWLAEQPKLAEASLFLPEQKSAELFGYYVMVNGVFNVIAALNTCIAEKTLFLALRHFLEEWQARHNHTSLAHYLLHAPSLLAKGNFLTFFQDIQENASEDEILAPYVAMANPIAGVR